MNRNSAKGQAMVEFALIVGLFAMVVFLCLRSEIFDSQEMISVSEIAHFAPYMAANPTQEKTYAKAAAAAIEPGLFGTKAVWRVEPCPALRSVPVGEAIICVKPGVFPSPNPMGQTNNYVEIGIVCNPAIFGPLSKLSLGFRHVTYIRELNFAA